MDGGEDESRPVTVDEAVRWAFRLQHDGRLDEAETLYRQVLKTVPNHPDALHFLGVLSYQKGNGEAAVDLIRRAVEASPGYADAHNNLGNVLRGEGRNAEAVAAYGRVVELAPDHADAHNNLGVALKSEGRLKAAVASYERAIALNPGLVDAHHNLGNALAGLDRLDEAVAAFRRALAVDSRYVESYKALSVALGRLGRKRELEEVVGQWLLLTPDHPAALHIQAACDGREMPERASDAYVRQLFDESSAYFDEHLQRLDYRAPRLVAAPVEAFAGVAGRQLEILDAGCGTGLCGPILRAYARRLVGIDLSPGMLEKARATASYDELVEGELTRFMQDSPSTYDAIVSADTLIYFGNLQPVLAAAARALLPGGRFVFTLERIDEDEAPAGFRLALSGRYGHTVRYVRRAVAAAGLEVAAMDLDVLRREREEPVHGLIVLACKGSS